MIRKSQSRSGERGETNCQSQRWGARGESENTTGSNNAVECKRLYGNLLSLFLALTLQISSSPRDLVDHFSVFLSLCLSTSLRLLQYRPYLRLSLSLFPSNIQLNGHYFETCNLFNMPHHFRFEQINKYLIRCHTTQQQHTKKSDYKRNLS